MYVYVHLFEKNYYGFVFCIKRKNKSPELPLYDFICLTNLTLERKSSPGIRWSFMDLLKMMTLPFHGFSLTLETEGGGEE